MARIVGRLELMAALRWGYRPSAFSWGVDLVLIEVSLFVILCSWCYSSTLVPVTRWKRLLNHTLRRGASLFLLSSLLLSKLMLDLELCLLFIHALINEHIHQKHLLLLSLVRCHIFLIVWCWVFVVLGCIGLRWSDCSVVTLFNHVRWWLGHLIMGRAWDILLSSAWTGATDRHVVYLLIGTLFSSSFHALVFAIFSSWSSLTWLETIINDERWFIDIQMSWVSRVVEVIVTLRLRALRWKCFDSSWSIINCLGRVLQRLFNLLLLFLAYEALHLLLRLFTVSWNRIRCSECGDTPLISFILHLFVLVEQFLLEVIVLLLILWSLIPWENIVSNTLKLPFHLQTGLLFLKLLKLLLYNHIVLLLLLKATRRIRRLVKRVSLDSTTVVFVWRMPMRGIIGWRSQGTVFLIIHWVILPSNVLNPVFMGVWLHDLLNASRERSLWGSLYLLINKPMLAPRILLQIIWRSLFKRVHWLQLSIIFSVWVSVSMPIHLGLWPLNILLLADIVTHCSWLLGCWLAWCPCFLGWVAYWV